MFKVRLRTRWDGSNKILDEFADLKVDLLLEDAAEARIDLSKMVSGHYHNIDDDFDPYDEDLQ